MVGETIDLVFENQNPAHDDFKVQCRLAIQGLKEKLEKQNGDLTRLSSFVYQDIASQLSRLSSEAYGHKPFSSVISQTQFPLIVAAEGVDSVKESNLDPSLTDDAELDVWRPRAHRSGISGDNRSDQGEIRKRDKVIDQEIAEIRRDLACKPLGHDAHL
uniref:Uncharacterized protein n=1 Tax=Spongospora subterranea TaxID=70186 RepID=A0A0H5QLU1_9EUKA|eukprot:CRZ02983.1 hypothetical protein [Spongospora subterranea]